MGQIKHKMGNVGGGVDISHKSKMSGKAKSLMSFPGGMPGPGNYGQMDNKVVGKGMAQYLAGESVGMKKYGQHKGPEKALVGKQENLPEGLKAKIEACYSALVLINFRAHSLYEAPVTKIFVQRVCFIMSGL